MHLTVTFKLGTNLDIAQVQVQNRVAIAQPLLPSDVQRAGIVVKKASPDITLAVAIYSPDGSRDPLYLSNYATLQIQDELGASASGSRRYFHLRSAGDYSMRLWLKSLNRWLRRAASLAGDVIKAVQEQNVQVAAGIIGGAPLPAGTAPFQLTVNAQGRLVDPKEFGEIIIKTGADGSLTRVKDVARVELAAPITAPTTHFNGLPARWAFPVFQLPGSNSIATADASLYRKMEELKKSFPPGVAYSIPYDTTTFVRDSIKDVVKTLFEAIALVALVVLVFLQSWRASLVPLLAIPVSLVGTFAVMAAFGFSLNNLSLFGLVLAIGIVVDDAIVVVEKRRPLDRTWPLSACEASYKAMEEVTPAVIAIAFEDWTAVFVPVAFISGITGQFYKQFALTISFSTLLSAFNSPHVKSCTCRSHFSLSRTRPKKTGLRISSISFLAGFSNLLTGSSAKSTRRMSEFSSTWCALSLVVVVV